MASERVQRRIERLLDQIEEEADQENWQRVCALAEQILDFAPNNADAAAFLASGERALSRANGRSARGATTPDADPGASSGVEDFTSTQPTSFASGRYEVRRFLGEGGKKKVYLAHDSLLDRDVAFALIKTEGLDEVSRTRITREAQAMGRLGSHPHIVTVFDLGEHEGQPYMVTELMGGGDVEGVVEDAPDHRLPLEQAISVAVETCRGLDFAHSRGIVHRDLKPGNVWLTGDGVAKIGDFGLAVAIDRSRLTSEGMMVGTVSYMPPEQAMGGEVTPRADLYSLGAMLYEMVAGRPPFLGDDSVAIIGQHINTPPVAPTWHNPQCPRPLEALILRLLAKDPSERPASASDVLTALEAVDLTISAETAQPTDEAHALDSLAGGVFVGRQREMGELKAALEDALSGRGRLLMLVGEPGIGKTRTAQELATYAGLRGAQVLWGRCYEDQGVPPYWPWVQAIRSYVRERESEQLRSELGSGAASIAEVVSDVRDRLPDLQPPPALESPEQARFRLFDSITAFLKSASQKQPLALVLDDLHWADQPSLLLLQFVAKELGGGRLLIMGTYRDMEVSRRHPLSQTLAELTRERLFQRVLLRGLSQEDVGRFIELVSGFTPPPALVESVHRQTEGNPLFVTEVVRLLVQEETLTPEGTQERGSWSVRIPEGVREVIGRRLDRLTDRCNQTLTVAAVVGREFSLEQLKPLLDDLTEDRLLEAMEEALQARVIEELPRAAGQYQFTHALIQETLADELSLTRRVRLHAQIAEVLERLYGSQTEAHAAELAHHFAQAETATGSEKLVHYAILAGQRALDSYANEDALAHFERALAARPEQTMDEQLADILFGLGRAQAATLESTERQQAVDTVRRAFDYYVAVGNAPKAIEVAGYPLTTAGSFPRGVREMLGQALTLVSPESHEAGRLLSRYGYFTGVSSAKYEEGLGALNRALDIARREEDRALEMRATTWSGAIYGQHLRLSECLEQSLRAIEQAPLADQPDTEVVAQFWILSSLCSLGKSERAQEHASALLSAAERSRQLFSIEIAYEGSFHLFYLLGDWQSANRCIERSQTLLPDGRRAQLLAISLAYETGDFSRGGADLTRLLGRMTLDQRRLIVIVPPLIAKVARISGDTSHLSTARTMAESILSGTSPPAQEVRARISLALIETLEGNKAAASEQYGFLEARGGFMDFRQSLNMNRVLGLLAHTMDEPDKATGHFEEAATFCRRAGYRPELAWTCCDYADTLLQRNNAGDQEKAQPLLDESLAISTELGMRPLMERVLSRRDILKA